MSTATILNVTGTAKAKELERLFKEHYQFVYRTAYSVTGNMQDAEDVLQTIFAALLRRDLPPGLHKNPKAYFYRAAFNLSLNRIRDRKHHVTTDDVADLQPAAADFESDINEELDERLSAAIAKLHPTAAQIVILRYVHGWHL